MRNFACFNELSMRPLCNSDVDATQRVNDFLLVLRDARSLAGTIKVRHEGDMTTISLTQSVSLMDYINSHTKEPAVIALLGIFILNFNRLKSNSVFISIGRFRLLLFLFRLGLFQNRYTPPLRFCHQAERNESDEYKHSFHNELSFNG